MNDLLKRIDNAALDFMPHGISRLNLAMIKALGLDLTHNQKNYLSTLNKYRFVISKKPRQVGETTLTIINLLSSFLEERKNILIKVNSQHHGYYIIQKMRRILALLNMDIEDDGTQRKNAITSKGKAIISDSSPHTRGITFDIVYISEAAFFADLESVYSATLPALSFKDSSKMIISSTPNGDNYFKTLYEYGDDIGFHTFNFEIHDNPLMTVDKIEYNINMNAQNHLLIRQEIYGEFVSP